MGAAHRMGWELRVVGQIMYSLGRWLSGLYLAPLLPITRSPRQSTADVYCRSESNF
jgi:hypothetical protein